MVELINEKNIVYEFEYEYKNICEKIKIPINKFKDSSNGISFSDFEKKLRIFGYLTNDTMQEIYKLKMLEY